MEEKDATEGVEVTHPDYGRGYISDYRPQFGSEPDEVTVHFYDADEQTLPVYAVDLAADVTTAGVTTGPNGYVVTVDDGHCTINIRPTGSGGAYEVELVPHGETETTVTLTPTES